MSQWRKGHEPMQVVHAGKPQRAMLCHADAVLLRADSRTKRVAGGRVHGKGAPRPETRDLAGRAGLLELPLGASARCSSNKRGSGARCPGASIPPNSNQPACKATHAHGPCFTNVLRRNLALTEPQDLVCMERARGRSAARNPAAQRNHNQCTSGGNAGNMRMMLPPHTLCLVLGQPACNGNNTWGQGTPTNAPHTRTPNALSLQRVRQGQVRKQQMHSCATMKPPKACLPSFWLHTD